MASGIVAGKAFAFFDFCQVKLPVGRLAYKLQKSEKVLRSLARDDSGCLERIVLGQWGKTALDSVPTPFTYKREERGR